MNQFKNTMSKHLEKLVKFVPVVARVHGEEHPEFHDVKAVFDAMHEQFNQDNLNMDDYFKQLRTITNHYEVPHDVCETYAAVYHMLQDLDQTYGLEA